MSRPSGCINGTIAGLLQTLLRLRDLGNTVVVVEHDAETMMAADHILDMGPAPGRRADTLSRKERRSR